MYSLSVFPPMMNDDEKMLNDARPRIDEKKNKAKPANSQRYAPDKC